MKTTSILIRLNPKEKEKWQEVAKANSQTLSAAIREAMLDYTLAGGPRLKQTILK